jgi:hypothetical protein
MAVETLRGDGEEASPGASVRLSIEMPVIASGSAPMRRPRVACAKAA